MKRYKQGSVHGRFQPFHKDHLRYCLEAKERCDFLWIGIAQFNIRSLCHSPKAEHRHWAVNNPLTYFERHRMITMSLIEVGLERDHFDLLPFPVDKPSYLPDFIPTSIPIFTTINDDWNRTKIKVLKQVGYTVLPLWEEKKKHEGMHIRDLMYHGDLSWKQHLPAAAASFLEEIDIVSRIRLLRDTVVNEQ